LPGPPSDSSPPALMQRIVEAFGARKHPKLIEQMQSEKVHVRIGALRALAVVLRNPQEVVSCIKAGLLKYVLGLTGHPRAAAWSSQHTAAPSSLSSSRVVVAMLNDGELKVRQGSSKALAIGCIDPNFRRAVLEVRSVAEGRDAGDGADGQPDVCAGEADWGVQGAPQRQGRGGAVEHVPGAQGGVHHQGRGRGVGGARVPGDLHGQGGGRAARHPGADPAEPAQLGARRGRRAGRAQPPGGRDLHPAPHQHRGPRQVRACA
jgi:hypothetical protein